MIDPCRYEEVTEASLLSIYVLSKLLASAVVDPLDLGWYACLTREVTHLLSGVGVEDTQCVLIITSNTHDVGIIEAEGQCTYSSLEEPMVDDIKWLLLRLRTRDIGGPYIDPRCLTHLTRRCIQAIIGYSDTGDIIIVGIEEELLVSC